MTSEEKTPVPPPPVAAEAAEEDWIDDEGDRATRSVPAILLAEIYARPPSNPPPAPAVPTNGMERMLITDAMLGRAPKLSTKTVKLPASPALPTPKKQ